MKNVKRFLIIWILIFLFWGCTNSRDENANNPDQEPEGIYYGIKTNGVLYGYSRYKSTDIEKNGKKVVESENYIFVKRTLFGSRINSERRSLSYIDPETKRCEYSTIEIKEGNIKEKITIKIKNNEAIISSLFRNQQKKVKLTPNTISDQRELLKKLKEDFIIGDTREKSYQILNAVDGKVRKSKFTKLGIEEIKILGNILNAVVIKQNTVETGVYQKWWLDQKNGKILKIKINNDVIFRTDYKVRDRIKTINMDTTIFTKANVNIADIHGIEYMKMKVRIAPTGVLLTPEKLNQSGQKFIGTVKNNVVEGILEIEHKKYDGENAPPYPPDFPNGESLHEYLQPGELIESDDPVLVKKAKQIAGGSRDSWEAAVRLSRWVAENISYGIPGGITARKTYDVKAGECGAHSNLMAAFCRAVGIPARVVWGAMYLPERGGSFGQHGWNEVYMGEAGWIPLDTTAHEIDFLDSAHIRIAEHKSNTTAFNGEKIEILDYRVNNTKMGEAHEASHQYDKYTGKYKSIDKKIVAIVKVQEGTLVVVPRKNTYLPLAKPDERGYWYCKLDTNVFFVFHEDPPGKVTQMELHQLVNALKKSQLSSESSKAPEKFRTYLGKYLLAATNETLTVFYKDGNLVIDVPKEKLIKLHPIDGEEKWIDQHNSKIVYFEKDDQGNINTMKIDVIIKYKRIDN